MQDDGSGPAEGQSSSQRSGELRRALTARQRTGHVLEDYRPVYECLDFRLSRRFWNLRASDAFIGGDVPYVVTNDGHLAANGVACLLASLSGQTAEKDEITVLELGAGSGIFAKQFMDQIRDLAPDVYGRLRFIATDGSAAMVANWEETGVFRDHADRIEGHVATLPGLDTALPEGQTLHCVFANYILDSLPFTLLACLGSDLWEMEVQTALDADVDPLRYIGCDTDTLSALAARAEDEDLDQMIDLYPALVLDARYLPVQRAGLAEGHTVPDASDGNHQRASPYLHSYGALQTIREVTDRLASGGFLAIADYGYDAKLPEQDIFEFQHFGGSAAIGLNFEAVDRVCGKWEGVGVVAPEGDNGQLLLRLIGRDLSPATRQTFLELAGKAHWEKLTEPLRAAQELTSNGHLEAARWKYEEALRLQPHNWALIEEAAGFLTYRLEAYEAGLMMAKAGIERNALSPNLWNIAGDCLFYTDHLEEAESAYRHANTVSPRDVRSLLNLAWVAAKVGQDAIALDYIAKGLAEDKTDTFREALLSKQSQILDARTAQQQNDRLRTINRIRGHRDLPSRD